MVNLMPDESDEDARARVLAHGIATPDPLLRQLRRIAVAAGIEVSIGDSAE